jgi:hypothetical protein
MLTVPDQVNQKKLRPRPEGLTAGGVSLFTGTGSILKNL